MTVIYNAIDDRFLRGAARRRGLQNTRERYQLDGPFVLYVGNIKPHKNLERLIEAFHLVRREGFERLKLLIIGDQISKYPRLRRAVDRHKLHKHVRFLGFVPYRHARVALPAGDGVRVPVALRRLRPAAPRSDGERHAGRGVEHVVAAGSARRRRACSSIPYQPSAIADGLVRVLSDGSLRASMREAGLRAGAQLLVGVIGAPGLDVYDEVGAVDG